MFFDIDHSLRNPEIEFRMHYLYIIMYKLYILSGLKFGWTRDFRLEKYLIIIKNNSYNTTFWYEDNHKPCKTHQPLIWTKAAEIFWCSKHDFHWGSFRMFLSLKKSFLACLNHNMAFNILSIKSWHNVIKRSKDELFYSPFAVCVMFEANNPKIVQ